MLYSAPPASPPPELRARILAATAPAQTTAPPKQSPILTPDFSRSRSMARIAAVAAVIAIVLLVGSNLYWLGQMNAMQAREHDLISLVTQQNQVLASFGKPGTRTIILASTAGTDNAQAAVFWRPDVQLALLTTSGLPALNPDRAYQAWLIRGDQPVGIGVFQVDENGHGVLIFDSDQPITDYDVIGITEEPADGSSSPTSNPILAGQV
jgi:anti-sigma-K factor RskA